MKDNEFEPQIKIIDTISRELEKNLPSPNEGLQIIVIIPAKDEGKVIYQTLASLANQKTQSGKNFDCSKFEILVLCHNCTDDTLQKCLQFSKEIPEINLHPIVLDSEDVATVGAARRVLMNIACNRLKYPQALIASTDADTIVDKQWLYQLGTYQEQDISLVCGIIDSNLEEVHGQTLTYLKAKDEYLMLRARLESQLLPLDHDPWPRHNYHWGPNMAIKKQVYQAIGGIRPLHFLEDVDLYNRVVSNGYLARHCMKTKVTTSTRTDSRCTEGFGAELRVWTEFEGVPYNVESLEKLLVRFKIYEMIELYFKSPSSTIFQGICEMACIEKEGLTNIFLKSPRLEATKIAMEQFLNKNPSWNKVHPNVGVLEANQHLRSYFKTSVGKSSYSFSQSINS